MAMQPFSAASFAVSALIRLQCWSEWTPSSTQRRMARSVSEGAESGRSSQPLSTMVE
jgi:hypothetical protein